MGPLMFESLGQVQWANGTSHLCALEEHAHDLIDDVTEEGDVPEEVGLHGSRMHGVGDDVVGPEPPGELPRRQQVGQLRGAVDSFGIIVPVGRRFCGIQ